MNKDLQLTLGKAARAARKALGLTQDNVAEKLGVSVEFYGRVERGAACPSIELLARMATILEVSTDSLLGIEPQSPPELDPLTLPDDSEDLGELIELVRNSNPRVVRLVLSMVRELEQGGDTSESTDESTTESTDTREPDPT